MIGGGAGAVLASRVFRQSGRKEAGSSSAIFYAVKFYCKNIPLFWDREGDEPKVAPDEKFLFL